MWVVRLALAAAAAYMAAISGLLARIGHDKYRPPHAGLDRPVPAIATAISGRSRNAENRRLE
jgi:hypothetical protein